MRTKHISVFLILTGLGLFFPGLSDRAKAAEPEREWTFLVYLNGDNSLDSFGPYNLNQMETVGSTDQVNVVVEWASMQTDTVKRLYIKKDNDINNVTSPVIEDAGKVDMGDWHSLVDFVKWGAEHYPAKHYFVDVWDHGNGWHIQGQYSPKDISWDDKTGSYITTEQLGLAMQEAAKIIGHKVDVYGSDACLMSMAEVSGELKDSVDVTVGSEQTEPGDGWPYDSLLAAWAKNPQATAADVGKMLTHAYVDYYINGPHPAEVTFSALDLSHLDQLGKAVLDLGASLKTLSADDRNKAVKAMKITQNFTYSDYGDVTDFMNNLEAQKISGMDRGAIPAVRDAVTSMVIAVESTPQYQKSHGISFWLPRSKYSFAQYSVRYAGLQFAKASGWGDALQYVTQDSTSDWDDGDDNPPTGLIALH